MKITNKQLQKLIQEEKEHLLEDEFGAESDGVAVQTEADEILGRLQELADGVGLALEPCVASYIQDLAHRLRGSF